MEGDADSVGTRRRIIRTGLRDKLPRKKNLAYPVGAEMISAKLHDVPQFDQMWIAFDRHEAFDNSKRVVMSATMNSGSWYLSVYAVPRQLSAVIKEQLAKEGLPRCAEWLALPRKPLWYEGHRFWKVLFDAEQESLSFGEGAGRGADV